MKGKGLITHRASGPKLSRARKQALIVPVISKASIFRSIGYVCALTLLGLFNAPQTWAQSQPADTAPGKPEFEVASVKPSHAGDNRVMIGNGGGGRFTANNVPLNLLIRMAYKVQDFQVTGLPGWASSEKYDIEAKPEGPAVPDMRKLTEEQREAAMDQQRLRVQALLADRFKLTLHRDTKELPVYALVVAKGGLKIHETTAPPPPPEPPNPQGPRGPIRGQGMSMRPGELRGNAVRLAFLVDALSMQLGRTVVDKTGLNGLYDFTLKWTPDESQGAMFKGPADGREGPDAPPPSDASGPSVFTAIQEQLGLKLESTKGPVEVLVIDHVEKPTEN